MNLDDKNNVLMNVLHGSNDPRIQSELLIEIGGNEFLVANNKIQNTIF